MVLGWGKKSNNNHFSSFLDHAMACPCYAKGGNNGNAFPIVPKKFPGEIHHPLTRRIFQARSVSNTFEDFFEGAS